jgi:hypothetical protein
MWKIKKLAYGRSIYYGSEEVMSAALLDFVISSPDFALWWENTTDLVKYW